MDYSDMSWDQPYIAWVVLRAFIVAGVAICVYNALGNLRAYLLGRRHRR